MQKTVLAVALASVFSVGLANAADLQSNDNLTQALTGTHSVADGQAIKITSNLGSADVGDNTTITLGKGSSLHFIHKGGAESKNNTLVNAPTKTDFQLGESGTLTFESQSTWYASTGMLCGNVNVTGGAESILNIKQTGSSEEVALAESHVANSALVLKAGTINIEAKSDRAILRQKADESLVIEAKVINIKGRVQQGGGGSTTIQGFDTLQIDGRGREALRIAAGTLTVDGGTTGTVELKNEQTQDSVINGHGSTNGTLNVRAGSVTVTGGENSAIGMEGGSLNLKADTLTISAKTAIDVSSKATVNMSSASEGKEQTAKIRGDIKVADGGTADITLNNDASSLEGAVQMSGSKASLGLKNGATWTVKGESTVSNLRLDNAKVDMSGTDKNVRANNLTGTAGNVVMDAKGTNTFTVTNETTTKVTAVASQDADSVNVEEAKQMVDRIGGQVSDKSAAVNEGAYNGAISVDGQGNVTITTNSLMEDTLTLGGSSLLSLNRILMNDVRKRMGDVRAMEGTTGAWARYDGGRLSATGLENDFNTIQVGADTLVPNTNWRVGLAASYTKGDNDFRRGFADLDAYMLTGYGLWMADNGMFADVVARLAKAENDMTVDGGAKAGKLDNRAYSLSGEFGWRFDLSNQYYVEPQAELTYTYVDSEDLDLGSAQYKFDTMTSFLGRVGVATGIKCPNNMGDLYFRVSAVHEFDGDAKITGANGTSLTQDGKDTWVEYGIGGNFNLTPTTYFWADLERTAGATLETDWRATFGVRHAF